jgi:hypothetical protein
VVVLQYANIKRLKQSVKIARVVLTAFTTESDVNAEYAVYRFCASIINRKHDVLNATGSKYALTINRRHDVKNAMVHPFVVMGVKNHTA